MSGRQRLAGCLAVLFACRIWGVELQSRNGHVPRLVDKLRPVAALQPARRLSLALGLPLRNREALTNLLDQLYDPASPNFRQFLSSREFAERFGPTERDYRLLQDFARSNHLALIGIHANRLLLDVNGTVADIERAFHLKLRVYRHPAEPRTFYSPDVEPSVDSRVPLLSVSGLDDFYVPRPMALRPSPVSEPAPRGSSAGPGRRVQPALDATGSGPAGTFLGRDFRAAYSPGVKLDGAGESIGLLELDSYYPSDITAYEDLAGLPRVPLTNVLVNGFNRAPGGNNNEVALDIEMVVAMAPGLDRVLVYEGSNGNDVLNRMATDNQARQLSSSWSFGHPVDATREQILQELAAQGQSFFQASGDSGAYGNVLFPPADDPFVTAVGGTSLVTSNGVWLAESAWSGSGGGVSPNFSIPVWQKALSMAANQGSTTMRNVPDVAALADLTIWEIANNGEQGTVGGTSAAAPLWAGLAAMANQQAAADQQPGIGFLNPALYAIGQGPAAASAFHDVSQGNNTNESNPSRFYAVPGYDLCTGWGTPNGSNLIQALLAPPDALSISAGTNLTLSGPVGGPFAPALDELRVTNSGPSSVAWSVNTTSTWLSVSPPGGVLSAAGPAALVSLGLTTLASNLAPGTYSADLQFTHVEDGFVQTRRITLYVVSPPLITSEPASQSLPSGATARFSVETRPNALLFYQWRANGTNLHDNARTSGAAGPDLVLTGVSRADNGSYSVIVSNSAGLVTSSAAQLTVTSSPPIIAEQPVSQTVLPGAPATFSVSVFGDSPISYQWQANGTNLADAVNLSGTRSNTLTFAAVSLTDAKNYSVVVSNALGFVTSLGAKLEVVALTSPETLQEQVYAFSGTDGADPNGLVRAANGAVYGTTAGGGDSDAGAIFELEPDSSARLIYSFHGVSDGERPNGDLVCTPTGIFGTTYGGGVNGFGTLFRLNADHSLTSLFPLDHTNGVLPTAGPVLGSDGSLYGTAYEGGVFHYGTVFRFDTNAGFTVVFPFATTNGAFPHGRLVTAADEGCYGTTFKGGRSGSGTVFEISPQGVFSTLAVFDGTNGAFPLAGLTQADDGSFYGTTSSGGQFGLGTVFRVTRQGSLTILKSFSGTIDGSRPAMALTQAADGNFYGTTAAGGAYDAGTVFRMSPGGVLTTVAEFDGFNGAYPSASLLEDLDGSLLGVTQSGGPSGQGVIFRLSIPASAPQLTQQPGDLVTYQGSTLLLRVASFGSPPLRYQWQKNGTNLADVANVSGSSARSLLLTNVTPADAGSYSVIVSNAFGSVLSSAASVQVLASAPVVTLQPTNQVTAPGSMSVFHTELSGNLPLALLWQFNGTNLPDSGNHFGSRTDTLVLTNVTEANNGTYRLFVTNALGWTNSAPAVLSVIPVSAPNTRLNTLYSFSGGDGAAPSELVDGGDGYLYGTTRLGGTFLDGTAFRVGTNGTFMTLSFFDLTNGGLPPSGLALATNGAFYGLTSAGGISGAGTVYAMDASGARSNLYDFSAGADGATPDVRLLQGTDGQLYGSTLEAGSRGRGTIFRIDPDGRFSVLHAFTGGTDGSSLAGPLVQTPDGNLYGATPAGGVLGQGSIFRLSPAGVFSTLYSFTGGMDGFDPAGGLAPGDDGWLYGVTRSNTIQGFSFYGTLFRISTNGVLTTLYSLNFSDGSYPAAGLVLGADGNFYGTTQTGGDNDFGTLFRMTPSGAVATLVSFDGFNDGAYPMTALTALPDGSLYGTTSVGGPGGSGTLFRLAFAGPPQITGQPSAQHGLTGAAARFTVALTGASPLFYQWQKDGTNLADSVTVRGSTTRVLMLSNLAPNDAGNYSVLVTNALGAVASSPALLTVTVSAPVFQSVERVGTNLLLSWSAASGRSYQVQSSSGLGSPSWNNVGSPVKAGGPSLQTSVPILPGPPQFFRVVLLP